MVPGKFDRPGGPQILFSFIQFPGQGVAHWRGEEQNPSQYGLRPCAASGARATRPLLLVNRPRERETSNGDSWATMAWSTITSLTATVAEDAQALTRRKWPQRRQWSAWSPSRIKALSPPAQCSWAPASPIHQRSPPIRPCSFLPDLSTPLPPSNQPIAGYYLLLPFHLYLPFHPTTSLSPFVLQTLFFVPSATVSIHRHPPLLRIFNLFILSTTAFVGSLFNAGSFVSYFDGNALTTRGWAIGLDWFSRSNDNRGKLGMQQPSRRDRRHSLPRLNCNFLHRRKIQFTPSPSLSSPCSLSLPPNALRHPVTDSSRQHS